MADSKRTPRPSLPTLVGLPRVDLEEPFPLLPYRDVCVYTPSHSRPVATPVYVAPARRETPQERELRRVLQQRSHDRKHGIHRPPSWWTQAFAACLVCYVIACLAAWTMF